MDKKNNKSKKFYGNIKRKKRKSAFLSYSTMDIEWMKKFKKALSGKFTVKIADESIAIGENIEYSLRKLVQNTDVTILIVSKNSLRSSWVALETYETLLIERLSNEYNKTLIPVIVDNSIYRDEFYIEAINAIDEKIKHLKKLIFEAVELNVSTANYEKKRQRLMNLRSNFGDVLDRIRSNLYLNFSDDNFRKNMNKLISLIKNTV